MSTMSEMPAAQARKFAPALFGLIVLCFLLPFVTVSCDSVGAPRQELTTMTGVEVMTGKTVSVSNLGAQPGHIDGEPLALVALVAALAGLAAGFVRRRTGLLGGAAAGGVAFLALLLTKFSLDNRVAHPASLSFGTGSAQQLPTGITISTTYQLGYWLALVLSAAAAGLFVYFLVTEAPEPSAADRPGSYSGGPIELPPE